MCGRRFKTLCTLPLITGYLFLKFANLSGSLLEVRGSEHVQLNLRYGEQTPPLWVGKHAVQSTVRTILAGMIATAFHFLIATSLTCIRSSSGLAV